MGKNQDQEKSNHDAINNTINIAVDLERKIQDVRNKISASHIREIDAAKKHVHEAIEVLKRCA